MSTAHGQVCQWTYWDKKLKSIWIWSACQSAMNMLDTKAQQERPGYCTINHLIYKQALCTKITTSILFI